MVGVSFDFIFTYINIFEVKVFRKQKAVSPLSRLAFARQFYEEAGLTDGSQQIHDEYFQEKKTSLRYLFTVKGILKLIEKRF